MVREVYLQARVGHVCLVNWTLTSASVPVMQVVREVYLPESAMWLSEYPFVDRSAFLDMSLAVERERQQQQQQSWQEGGSTEAGAGAWDGAGAAGAEAWREQGSSEAGARAWAGAWAEAESWQEGGPTAEAAAPADNDGPPIVAVVTEGSWS